MILKFSSHRYCTFLVRFIPSYFISVNQCYFCLCPFIDLSGFDLFLTLNASASTSPISVPCCPKHILTSYVNMYVHCNFCLKKQFSVLQLIFNSFNHHTRHLPWTSSVLECCSVGWVWSVLSYHLVILFLGEEHVMCLPL